jgi:sporulation protein YtfJ
LIIRKAEKTMNKLPGMLEGTVAKMKELVDVNSVIGDPITTVDGVTIIPISKVSVGFVGGGSDYVSKNLNKQDNPFGGGVGGGMSVTPVAFMVIREGNVRMIPVALPANTTAERVVELVPDVLDKLTAYIDSRLDKGKAE